MATVRVFKHHIHSSFYGMAALDLLGMSLAIVAGTYLHFLLEPGDLQAYLTQVPLRALLFAAVALISLFAMGLYDPRMREGAAGVLTRTVGGFTVTFLIVTGVFYAMPEWPVWQSILLYSMGVAVTFNVLNRLVFTRLTDLTQFKQRILVYGSGEAASTITKTMRRRSDRKGFTIVGFVRVEDEEPKVSNERVINVPHQSLAEYALQTEIDQIVIALDERRGHLPVQELMQCKVQGIKVHDLVSFFEREAGKVLVDFAPPGWMLFSDGFKYCSKAKISKRLFDIAAASVLLLVTWPVMLLTMLAIWLEDGFRAPVFFHQHRVGLNGKVFSVLKFRSMRIDAEGDGKARWATKNDDRVTHVGRFIRKTRIDELPQIFNVLSGDMAFIGPRPERPEFVQDLVERIPYYHARHYVKPGISGWAQLRYPYGSSEHDAQQKLQFDLYYVKNHSFLLDLIIALNTVEVVLFGKGAR